MLHQPLMNAIDLLLEDTFAHQYLVDNANQRQNQK
jgi:hypothetical protein